MQSLKPTELKSLEQFFLLRQESLLKVMYKFLTSKYDKVYGTKDYLIAVGDIPVALVAHMDTVFATPPENIFYDRVKNVMWSPNGLGADDRAGVYSIVQVLKQGLRPSIILTTEEEKGALGATAIIKDFPEAPMELKYIIELDRRGSIDCVFYDCDNPDFEEYVESFGFVTAWGTFTDISVICPAWKVAGVNLSTGYEDEHSYSETLYVGHMQATIKKVIQMLQTVDKLEKPFQYIPHTPYSYSKYSYLNKIYDDDYGWDPSFGVSKSLWKSWCTPKDDPLVKCKDCGRLDYDYNLFPIKGLEDNTIFLCTDCLSKRTDVSWCQECKEPYLVKEGDKDTGLCYDCQERSQVK